MYAMGVTHPLCPQPCLAHILASAIEAGVKNRKLTNTESSPDGASHLTNVAFLSHSRGEETNDCSYCAERETEAGGREVIHG